MNNHENWLDYMNSFMDIFIFPHVIGRVVVSQEEHQFTEG